MHHIPQVTGEFRTRQDATQMTFQPKYKRDHFRNLILFGNGLFPLTGQRLRPTPQGSGSALKRELARLLARDRTMMQELELRKLFGERYYALFYQLGKRMRLQERWAEAREAFASARRLAPLEPKTYFAEAGAWWKR